MPRSAFYLSLFMVAMLRSKSGLSQSFVACEPYGGKAEVLTFLEREMHFPDQELQAGIKGDVVLIFTIDRSGAMRDLRIWRSLTPACDTEALRLGALVRWHPGTLGGNLVDAEHYLKVPFHARSYGKRMAAGDHCPSLTGVGREDPDLVIRSSSDVDTTATPQITGGLRGLDRYFSEHMTYPPDAAKRDIQGVVELAFVVERSGVVSNLWAIRDLGGGCGEEVKKVIRSICWTPAIKNGRRVRSEVKVTLTFKLTTRTR